MDNRRLTSTLISVGATDSYNFGEYKKPFKPFNPLLFAKRWAERNGDVCFTMNWISFGEVSTRMRHELINDIYSIVSDDVVSYVVKQNNMYFEVISNALSFFNKDI